MSQLHICLVVNNYSTLRDRFLGSILNRFKNKGYKVTVLSWKSSAQKSFIQVNGTDVWFLGEEQTEFTIKDFPLCVEKKLVEVHKKNPINLIHCVDSNPFENLEIFKKKYKVPIVCDIRCTSLGVLAAFNSRFNLSEPWGLLKSYIFFAINFIKFYIKHDRYIFNVIDGIFVQTSEQKSQIAQNYRFPPSKIYLTPYGLDLNLLQQEGATQQEFDVRKKLGLKPDDKIVLTEVSDINIWTFSKVLRAFSQIAAKTNKTHLIILQNTGNIRLLQQEILDNVLDSRAHIVAIKKSSDQRSYIKASEAVLSLVSHYFLMDNLIVESIVLNKPIIISKYHPIASFFKHKKEALIIDPHDKKGLYSTFQQIFINSTDYSELGKASHKKISSTFSIEKVLQSTSEGYEQVIEKFNSFL